MQCIWNWQWPLCSVSHNKNWHPAVYPTLTMATLQCLLQYELTPGSVSEIDKGHFAVSLTIRIDTLQCIWNWQWPLCSVSHNKNWHPAATYLTMRLTLKLYFDISAEGPVSRDLICKFEFFKMRIYYNMHMCKAPWCTLSYFQCRLPPAWGLVRHHAAFRIFAIHTKLYLQW